MTKNLAPVFEKALIQDSSEFFWILKQFIVNVCAQANYGWPVIKSTNLNCVYKKIERESQEAI